MPDVSASEAGSAFAKERALLPYCVGADSALIGGRSLALLSPECRALDLDALQDC